MRKSDRRDAALLSFSVGSQWRRHRQLFEHGTMEDRLGGDYALTEKNALYRCLEKR
jgi:hypothetical protein